MIDIMDKPEKYIGKFAVMFISVAALIFISGSLRRLLETSINSRDFSKWLSALPDFLSSSLILSIPSIIPAFFLFSIFEKMDAPRYLKISSYAAALMSLPLILFFWGIIPKGHNLQASNTYCETYIDGSLTSCGLAINSLALIGSILIALMIVSIKNMIFSKGEMR